MLQWNNAVNKIQVYYLINNGCERHIKLNIQNQLSWMHLCGCNGGVELNGTRFLFVFLQWEGECNISAMIAFRVYFWNLWKISKIVHFIINLKSWSWLTEEFNLPKITVYKRYNIAQISASNRIASFHITHITVKMHSY